MSVLRGHSVFNPRHNDLWLRRISIPDFIHFFLSLILEKEPVFPYSMLSANKGTTGTILLTPLVSRALWLGIETRDLPHSKPALYH